ncbi:hypothetical protein CDV36_013549 [Fusarium kuroshium]|uniref:Uncharacterized protein n=2 Tax=Fusarium solani species complex TaxID=232080 RepID=A0A3M2RNJ0_9HYPO|nr:hypothetical protein CDV36_013549 [Fusarium kuroshium]RSL73502.1 hypothetical protein CEP51_011753 [Fusarium floridanum]
MNSSSASSSASGPAYRPELAPTAELLKHVFMPVVQPDEPYVDIDAHNKRLQGLFEFSIQQLDFSTGQVLDKEGRPSQADLYFRPVSPQKMQAWLDESKPFNHQYDYEPADSYCTRDKGAHTAGSFVTNIIDNHVRDSADASNLGAMPTHTTWASVGMPRFKLLYRAHIGRADWRPYHVYRQFPEPMKYTMGEKANPEKPHVIITLAEGARLKDGILCTSELSTLLYFAADSSVSTVENPHVIYPVMAVTASCDTVRLTQAIWNVKTGQIEIRMSPVLEFPGGLWKNKTQYLSLLGWVLSDPIGKTR